MSPRDHNRQLRLESGKEVIRIATEMAIVSDGGCATMRTYLLPGDGFLKEVAFQAETKSILSMV
jgi:hypothetical protein